MLDLSQPFHFSYKIIPSHQSWGRYLYFIQQNQQHYWLKCQHMNQHEKRYSFEYECQIYQLLQQFGTQYSLNYQQQTLSQTLIKTLNLTEHQSYQGLILPHYQAYFEQMPSPDLYILKQNLWQILNYLAEFHQLGFIHGDIILNSFQNNTPIHLLRSQT